MYGDRIVFTNIGGCPRISFLFKIKAFSKNTHSYIVNISESRTSLTGALFFGNNAEFGQNDILGQAPRLTRISHEHRVNWFRLMRKAG